ncbi:unnamed protein product [Brassica oleracea]|uniref:(rape) hypothetical protein n=1 Tax=Brassica napus TaxID=3708 RepID=A0A816RQE2_BRANA|nr:unnamed protein product [Brassica napus]
MGIIEHGAVSGTLPSKEAFVVHFPGYPSSIPRAIETLGGVQGITEARGSFSNKLELRFRPEDPYAHPALGEQRPCSGFLLKISKQEVKKPDSQPVVATSDVSLKEASPALCADIVARVSDAFHFDGMADYQHVIPIHADIARQKKRKWMDVDPLAGGSDLMGLADEDVMMLLPQVFAPKDIPDNLALKPPATSGPKKKDDAATQNFYETSVCLVLVLNYHIHIPKNLNWEEFVSPSSHHWQWQVSLSALFEERPIWTRDSVVQRLLDKGLKCTHHMLNRYLLRAAYYFSNGPFLRFWIKRGYDPRNDPESRVYQRMEFRVPPELRSYCDANATNKSKPRWNDICAFKLFPFKCQTFLQLFELDDEYIQREIRKPRKQTTCSHKTGWFSEALLDTLRLRVAVRFVSVFPEPGFEDVFKSIQEEFERSEKIQTFKETHKPSLVKHKEPTKGSEDMEKFKSTNDDVDVIVNEYGDDEDQDEEEEEDEEELYVPTADDEISIDSHGYLDTENSSRTYLQGLFDSFPTSEPGLYGDFAVDDGEFQIYEEESDEGLYSIDDNDGEEEEDDDDDDAGYSLSIPLNYAPFIYLFPFIPICSNLFASFQQPLGTMSDRSSRSIYVGNLPGDIRESEIEDLFYKYGRIVDIELKVPPRPPCYCFIEFEHPRDAKDAVDGRDGYNFDGCRLRVELSHGGRGQSSGDRRGGYGGGGGYRGGGGGGGGSARFGVSRHSEFRVIVRGLPSSASWQDLKDHMRKAGDVCFAEVTRDRDGAYGVVDYTNYDDMKYAIRKLDDTEFKNPWARGYIRVKKYESSQSRSPSRSRSRSRGRDRSRNRSRSISRSKSPRKDMSKSPRRSPAKSISKSRSPSPDRKNPLRSRSRSRSLSKSPAKVYNRQ